MKYEGALGRATADEVIKIDIFEIDQLRPPESVIVIR